MSERMTDLERARLTYGTIRDFGWDVLWRSANPIPDDAWPIDIIANALAAARREGAEQASGEIHALRKALHEETMKRLASAAEMRERAADQAHLVWGDGQIAASIRALPLTPGEPT